MNIKSGLSTAIRLSAIVFLMSILVGAFFLPLQSFAAAASSQPASQYFRDVLDNHPFAKAVNGLKKKDIIKGYSNNTFLPDNSISRAELLALVMSAAAKTPTSLTGANCFTDVKEEWFAGAICTAKAQGFIKGYDDGSFKPNSNINFAEASAIIAKAFKLNSKAAKKGEAWYKPYIVKLAGVRAIPVTIDYMEKKVSRGETAEIVWRLKSKIRSRTTKLAAELLKPLPSISSCGELKDKVAAYAYKSNRSYYSGFGTGLLKESMSGLSAPMTLMAPQADMAEGGGGGERPDYSSTNVQVEGVDEADIIKNDSEFIYMVKGRDLRIVKAYPPTAMTEVAKYKFDDNGFSPSEMFVSGDKLVVLGSTYVSYSQKDQPEPAPYYFNRGGSRAKLYILNIADKQNITKDRTVEIDGYAISSRRIGNRVYLVINDSASYYDIQPLLEKSSSEVGKAVIPSMLDSSEGKERPVCGCADIRFLPRYDNMNFLVVASLDIENPDSEVQKETIMGTGDTVYASSESIYIAGTRYDYPEVERFDVFAPPTTTAETTAVHRFGLADGVLSYKGKGEVAGHLLNQFSMDEYGDTFRLATTVGEVWNSQKPSTNNLFVLDRNSMGTVLGKIENIAPGEKIYSVRFMGERAYMVTFKKVDPFFVIGLSDPAHPQILGELKIPGYSDYLHPYDENHIIGFGKEAIDPTELEREGFNNGAFNFAWYQGMKIALFDVTDVANPTLMFKEVVGDRGTESDLFYNHKALMYDKARGLFAFPVTVNEIAADKKNNTERQGNIYGEPVFQGAYVYTLNLTDGFKLKGTIKNYDGDYPRTCSCTMVNGVASDCTSCWSNLSYEDQVSRVVYIGDYLYAVSPGKVKSVSRESMEEAGAVKLAPENGDGLVPPIIY